MFPESKIAHQYLDGLKGIEIGGSAHNRFGLNTQNCDNPAIVEAYKEEQVKLCGSWLPVDVPIEDAGRLPMFADKSVDFVLNSHVIEHIWRPDLALIEWCRVARKYIFLVIPHKDRTFDKDRPETLPIEIFTRPMLDKYEDKHHNVWKPESFMAFLLQLQKNNHRLFSLEHVSATDDKVGNGFIVVLKVN